MAICVTKTISALSNTQFFSEYQPEKHNDYIEWIRNCRGFVSFTEKPSTPTANGRWKEQKIMFDSDENFTNFMNDTKDNMIVQENIRYNQSHHINVITTILII